MCDSMNVLCDWQFIDKDRYKKWTVISIAIFSVSFLCYILLRIFAAYPHRYSNICVWICVIAFGIFFFSKTPRFFWKETTIKLNKTGDRYLVVFINQGVLEDDFLLDCKYVFSDYKVFVSESLGRKVINIRGVCSIQYIYNEAIFGIDYFEDKWLTLHIEQGELKPCVEYFQL